MNAALINQISDQILQLVEDLPDELIGTLVENLEQASWDPQSPDWPALRARISGFAPQIGLQERLHTFLEYWKHSTTDISPSIMALVINTVSRAIAIERCRQKVELAWTGPSSPYIPLRRTDQALLQLIQSANQRLLIVSFAVYKARSILNALEQAIQRGVDVTICVEFPSASEGRITLDPSIALGEQLYTRAWIYVWPLDQRSISADGKRGALHAKVAVADGKALFISSANLTDYAMNLNMELGILIEGEDLPKKVEQHFQTLIANGVLVIPN